MKVRVLAIARTRPWRLCFAAALAVAIATRLALPFDGLYGQDAFAYFGYARALWPHLRHAAPLPQLYWPIGYPVTVAALLPFTGGSPLAGQVVSALACAWAAAATSLLARDLGGHDGPSHDVAPALVAGLATALSGAVLRSSQVVMADALGLGAAATALWCAARYVQTWRGSWLVGCGVAFAWGTLARWLDGLLAFPLGLFLLLHAWRYGRRSGGRACVRLLWPSVSVAALAALALLIPGLAVAHSTPPALEKHEWLVNWGLRNAFGRDFHTPDGHGVYRLPVALFYFVRLGWPDYFFPIYGFFAMAGGWVLLRDRRWPCAALLLGWPAAAWIFLSGIPYENPRFLLPTLPAIGALAGIGFGALRSAASSGMRRALAAVISVAAAAGIFFGAREHARLVAKKNADRDLVAWAAKRLPPDAAVVMEGPTLAFRYYASISARDLFSTSTAEIAALAAGESPLFLIVNPETLETQWAGLNPERDFDALRRGPGLSVVGIHPPYTLFRVRSAERGRAGAARRSP